jgi:hypothetical protein
MEVGQLATDGSSFDIASMDETNSILIRNSGINKFLYKDEQNRLITLIRTEPERDNTISMPGSLLQIDDRLSGIAVSTANLRYSPSTVAKLLVEVDWTLSVEDLTLKFETKLAGSPPILCVLAPVSIM